MRDQIYLAPLEGMTDSVYRTCYYEHFGGLDRALTPFLPVPDHVVRVPASVFRDVSPPGRSPVPEIPQLLLSTPRAFLTAGRALERAGYAEVNWNLGCPSRGVVNKGKGAGMMPRTGDILNLLDEVLPRLSLDISLKIRLGMHHPDESTHLVRRLNDYPLKELMIHPRLGRSMYEGQPDWEHFGVLADLTDLPLVYNGDILCFEDFAALKKRFPFVSRWMIGRGILSDPFLPEILRSGHPAQEEINPPRETRYRVFLEALYERYEEIISSERHRLGRMKGLLVFAIRGRRGEDCLKQELFGIGNTGDLRKFLDRLFQISQ